MERLIRYIIISFALTGCASSGSMVATSYDNSNGQKTEIVYSKYFDGGDWIIPNKLGLSVVIDNDTPMSQQMFGGVRGKDSIALGSVVVYFWNLGTEPYQVKILDISLGAEKLNRISQLTVGSGPFIRTGQSCGSAQFFSYATKLNVVISFDVGGQTMQRNITAVRRTNTELKKYWGAGGVPPYPWFDSKSAYSWSEYTNAQK